MSANTALELEDVVFRYQEKGKRNILDHTSLSIPAGTLTVLMGGSGCGKSTLLKKLCGQDVAACGTLALGAGLYTLALVLFFALLCSMSGLPALETHLKDRSNHFEVHLELKNREDLQRFITTMRTLGLKIDDIEANPAYINSGLSVYSVSLTVRQKDRAKYSSHQEMIEAINTLDFVYYAEEID